MSYLDDNYKSSSSNLSNIVKHVETFSSAGNNSAKEVKCWGCDGPHLYRNSPHNPNRKMNALNILQEASTINHIATNIPRINAALEDC